MTVRSIRYNGWTRPEHAVIWEEESRGGEINGKTNDTQNDLRRD